MANQTFQVGDSVWHRSGGGPQMTVTATGFDGNRRPYVTCQWWHKTKEYFAHDDFQPEVLTTENPSSSQGGFA